MWNQDTAGCVSDVPAPLSAALESSSHTGTPFPIAGSTEGSAGAIRVLGGPRGVCRGATGGSGGDDEGELGEHVCPGSVG